MQVKFISSVLCLGCLSFATIIPFGRVAASDIIISQSTELETITTENEFYPPRAIDGTEDNNFAVVATNRKLSDFELVAAKITLSTTTIGLDATICNIQEVGGGVEFQVQIINDVYIKATKVRLFQREDDICAQAIWARYVSRNNHEIGTNMEVDYMGEATVLTKLVSPSNATYGLYSLTLKEKPSLDNAEILGERGITDEDTVTIAANTVVKVDDTTAAVAPFAKAAVTMNDSSQMVFVNRQETEINNTFTGSRAKLLFQGFTDDNQYATLTTGGGRWLKPGEKGTSDSCIVTLADNFPFEDIVDVVSADIYQSGLMKAGLTVVDSPEQVEETGGIFHVERTATNIIFQIQYITSDNWNKCTLVEVFASGNSVKARAHLSYYQHWKSGGAAPLGVDYRTIQATTQAGFYPVSNVIVRVRARSQVRINENAKLSLSNNSSMELSGRQSVMVKSTNGLPAGNITVADGSELLIYSTVNPSASSTLTVKEGGVVNLINTGHQVGGKLGSNISDHVIVDGGKFVFSSEKMGDAANSFDAGFYVLSLVVRNGGEVIGGGPRVNGANSVVWSVGGSKPCYIDCGALLVMSTVGYNKGAFTLNVDDVTGDDEADLVTGGNFEDFYQTADKLYGTTVRKNGIGTWRMNSVSKYWGFTDVKQGTLLYGIAEPIPNSAGVVLNGGSLAVADGLVATVKTFQLKVDGTIKIGAGSSLAIPNPTVDVSLNVNSGNAAVVQKGATFADEAKLTIVFADKTSRLRIGETACLSKDQLEQMSFVVEFGERKLICRAQQDSEGYLHATPLSTTVIVK